jgi:hypothetical protein
LRKLQVRMVWQSRPGLMTPPGPSWARAGPGAMDIAVAKTIADKPKRI